MTNEQLKAWRQRLQLGEAGMAAYLGTPVTTYRKWENGTRQPDSSTRRLFDVLQLVEQRMPEMHTELIGAAVASAGPEKVRKPRKVKTEAPSQPPAPAPQYDTLPAWMLTGSNPPR